MNHDLIVIHSLYHWSSTSDLTFSSLVLALCLVRIPDTHQRKVMRVKEQNWTLAMSCWEISSSSSWLTDVLSHVFQATFPQGGAVCLAQEQFYTCTPCEFVFPSIAKEWPALFFPLIGLPWHSYHTQTVPTLLLRLNQSNQWRQRVLTDHWQSVASHSFTNLGLADLCPAYWKGT